MAASIVSIIPGAGDSYDEHQNKALFAMHVYRYAGGVGPVIKAVYPVRGYFRRRTRRKQRPIYTAIKRSMSVNEEASAYAELT